MKISLKILIIIAIAILIILTLSTKYIGSTDVGSYADPAKYFAGDYQAKIRNSHSYLLGFIHSPFVKLTSSFISFKISSLIFLFLIILSVYYISKKNMKALILMLFSPIVWYLAPWINVLQIASLFFLWGYYFISEFNTSKKTKHLIYSGIFLGLSAAFWHGAFFFIIPLALIYLYDKKLISFFIFFIALLIGMLPLFILDTFLFSFPFHSLIKSSMGTISNIVGNGIYSTSRVTEKSFATLFSLLIIIPIYFWKIIKPKNFKKNIKNNLFLLISIIIIFLNPQVRYLLVIIPIIILSLYKELNQKQYIIQIAVSLIVILIVINPYLIQIKYATNASDIVTLFENFPNIKIDKIIPDKVIETDLNKISNDYPNQTFLVGNLPDDYAHLARVYWGKDIKEFVSIQDYQLYLENKTVLFEKVFRSKSNIAERREFYIIGGIGKPLNDPTNYSSIFYALSEDKTFPLSNFKLIKNYDSLTLWEKY